MSQNKSLNTSIETNFDSRTNQSKSRSDRSTSPSVITELHTNSKINKGISILTEKLQNHLKKNENSLIFEIFQHTYKHELTEIQSAGYFLTESKASEFNRRLTDFYIFVKNGFEEHGKISKTSLNIIQTIGSEIRQEIAIIFHQKMVLLEVFNEKLLKKNSQLSELNKLQTKELQELRDSFEQELNRLVESLTEKVELNSLPSKFGY